MAGAVSHEDRFGEEPDVRTRLFREPAAGGLVPIDDEVVGGIALGADELVFERAGKGAARQSADGVGAGTNRCNPQGHLAFRLSLD